MLDKAFREQDQQNKEDIRKTVTEVFSVENIELKSVLTPLQIVQLVRGFTFARKYKSEYAEFVCTLLLKMAVSGSGLGRKNLITVLAASIATFNKDRETMRERVLGGGR